MRCAVAKDGEDHDVVIRPLPVEVAAQPSFLYEPTGLEDMPGARVVLEHVDPQLDQIHLVEGEADQGLDGIAAESTVPCRRLADEQPEPAAARHPVDVVNGRIADVRPIVATLDGEVTLVRVGVHGPLQPLHFVLKRDRIARVQRAYDVRIVHPAVTALGVLAVEGPKDDVLAGDHEAPPRHLARIRREVAFGAIRHVARNYSVRLRSAAACRRLYSKAATPPEPPSA